MKSRWWMISAAVIGALMLMLGIGNLIDPEDTGPLYGQLILLAVMAAGATLIAYGLALVLRKQVRGSRLVALGVLPGSIGIGFFWFPPAVAVGIFALITSWAAFKSAESLKDQAVPS